MDSQVLFHAGLLAGATWVLDGTDRSGLTRISAVYPDWTIAALMPAMLSLPAPTLTIVRLAMGRSDASRRVAARWLESLKVCRPLHTLDEPQFAVGFICGIAMGTQMARSALACLERFAANLGVPGKG